MGVELRARAGRGDRRLRAVAACAGAEELFSEEVKLRKRAADVVRRITDRDPAPLQRYADELAGLLESLPPEESQTRWHLALAVSRVAHTQAQRLRAARIMSLLVEDESNALRCAAMEGMAEPELKVCRFEPNPAYRAPGTRRV